MQDHILYCSLTEIHWKFDKDILHLHQLDYPHRHHNVLAIPLHDAT